MLFKNNVKNLVFIVMITIITILLFHIYTSNKENIINQELELVKKTTNPIEILERHLMHKKQKKKDLILTTMTHHNKNMELKLNNISSFEVLKIVEKKNDALAQSYISSISPFAVTSFDVTFKIEYYKEKENSNGVYTWRYIIIKEEMDSPWLVYTWGIDF